MTNPIWDEVFRGEDQNDHRGPRNWGGWTDEELSGVDPNDRWDPRNHPKETRSFEVRDPNSRWENIRENIPDQIVPEDFSSLLPKDTEFNFSIKVREEGFQLLPDKEILSSRIFGSPEKAALEAWKIWGTWIESQLNSSKRKLQEIREITNPQKS